MTCIDLTALISAISTLVSAVAKLVLAIGIRRRLGLSARGQHDRRG